MSSLTAAAGRAWRIHLLNCWIADHGSVLTRVRADAAAEKNTRASFKAAVDRRLSRKAVVILDAPNYIKGFRCAVCQVAQTLPQLRLLPFRFSWQAANSPLQRLAAMQLLRFLRSFSATLGKRGSLRPLRDHPRCQSCRYEIWCIARAAATRSCVLHCDVPAQQCREWNAARSEQDAYSPAVFDDLAGRFERPDGRSRWDSPLFECVSVLLALTIYIYNSLTAKRNTCCRHAAVAS